TYDLKPDSPGDSPTDAFEEFDTEDTVDAIARALGSGGHEIVKLGGGKGALKKILAENWNAEGGGIEFIFNLAEGAGGRAREAQMPALFELFGIPYTGSDPLTLALALDKAQAKIMVSSAGVRTAEFRVAGTPAGLPDSLPAFPLFVKPLCEGSSKGIRFSSVVSGRQALEDQMKWLRSEYGDIPVLIERYIPGREFAVGVLGNEPPGVLGVMEIRFRDPGHKDFVYSLEVKRDWQRLCEYVVPAEEGTRLGQELKSAALAAFQSLGCRDVARIDFRVNDAGEVYFLEANPLPGLSPVSGDLVIMARGMGWKYEDLILAIFNHSLARQR
ncbi:MAG: D-alanine--D-alanine ligase, partial [Candidatus Omnitrophica bacterium]|nr:D-alanine--D-alanine ligase [Candidatus Omnitrophota bacterium]